MEAVTISQVQELVSQLPMEKLPHALEFLRKLTEQEGARPSPRDFLQLPLDERRRRLAEQADQLKFHYHETAVERQEWQTGEFRDEY